LDAENAEYAENYNYKRFDTENTEIAENNKQVSIAKHGRRAGKSVFSLLNDIQRVKSGVVALELSCGLCVLCV
jgi:phage antirepressor YoqD-like protein